MQCISIDDILTLGLICYGKQKVCDFDHHSLRHYAIFNFAIFLNMQYCVVSDMKHSAIFIYAIFFKIA